MGWSLRCRPHGNVDVVKIRPPPPSNFPFFVVGGGGPKNLGVWNHVSFLIAVMQ